MNSHTPKYTDEQLRTWARRAEEARKSGDPAYVILIANLCIRTGWTQGQCIRGIQRLAA